MLYKRNKIYLILEIVFLVIFLLVIREIIHIAFNTPAAKDAFEEWGRERRNNKGWLVLICSLPAVISEFKARTIYIDCNGLNFNHEHRLGQKLNSGYCSYDSIYEIRMVKKLFFFPTLYLYSYGTKKKIKVSCIYVDYRNLFCQLYSKIIEKNPSVHINENMEKYILKNNKFLLTQQ